MILDCVSSIFFPPIQVIFGMTKCLEFIGRKKRNRGVGVGGVVGRRKQKLNRHIIQMQTDQK